MADDVYTPEQESKIRHFCTQTGVPRLTAEFFLGAFDWKLQEAVSDFLASSPPPTFSGLPDVETILVSPSYPVKADARNQRGAAADPIGFFCECTGQCREAALFYLEGFRWKLDDAINGYQNNLLPPLGDTNPPPSPPEEAMAIARKSGTDHPAVATKRPRSYSPPPPSPESESEDESFTFPKLKALTDYGDDDAISSDNLKDTFTGLIKAFASTTAPSSPSRVGGSLEEGEALDQLSIMESSTALSICEPTLEIQLADGTETVAKFNSRDKIRDIRDYIDSTSSGEPKDYQLLVEGPPQRELTDMDQTIVEAGIIDSRLIQKYHDQSNPSTSESTMAADSPVNGLILGPRAQATTVKVVLRDATELEFSFTYDRTIRDIHERIEEERPNEKDYYLLAVETEPEPKALIDLDQTIEEAAFKNSILLMMDLSV